MALTRDPGLQPERTSMAWSRTGLLMATNAALFLRGSYQTGDVALLLLGAFLMGSAAWLAVFARRRDRELRLPQPPCAARVTMAAVSVITSIATWGGLWVVWIS